MIQLYNIGNRRLFYPSPGIDFEVSGVKFDGAGVNSRRGGVGSLCCYYYYNRGRVHFLMYSIVLLYNSLRPPNARNTSLCRYTGVHVTTCIPMCFTGSSLLLTGTLVGLTKQRDIIGCPAPYAHSTPLCPGLGLTEIHLGPHTPLGSRAAHGRSGSLSRRFQFKCAD